MKKISNRAGILLIATAMILSAVAVTADTEEQTIGVNCSIGSGSVPGAIGPVVWDNDMDFTGLGAAQKDTNYPFHAECADDFHFDEDTEVEDVHWVGGYWQDGYASAHWPWEITFYNDRGDGEAPGDVFAGPFEVDNTQYTEELIQDTGTSIYYTYSVVLDESIIFPACTKFWITIRGVGFFPPQSGWGYHDTILLWEAVFRSELLGYPEWTDSTLVWGAAKDMAFQLTGPLGPVAPTPPDIDGPGEGPADTEICWTFHSSDENGDLVKYFIDWGDGTSDETDYNNPCSPVEVCHTYAKGEYTITAYAEDETGLQSGSSTFDIIIPRARSVYHPLVVRLFERFPNVFPILRQLLGL
ncbi:MAG: hypothetical protein AYK22_00420 [Thermoplasmatales archaeon SG8-52-3]|nr:MAG: hypothetical protein AYK22_00420 [Thermoplasmatales archaeon SG8-52-3]